MVPTSNDAPPADLIGLKEACSVLPSCRPGKKRHLSCLYRWILDGKLKAWKVNRYLFVSRAELVGLLKPVGNGKPIPQRAIPDGRAVLARYGIG